MIRTESAGGVVLNRSGEVALVTYPDGGWTFPKGHIDPGEDALTAAVREIYEETGIGESALSFVKPLAEYERARMLIGGGDDPNEIKLIHMYLFHTDQERLAPVDPLHPEARWVQLGDVSELLTHQKDKEFFEAVRDQLT